MGRIVFRADASPTIGGGHVARCLSLADALAAEGWHCLFATGPDSLRTVPDLARYPIVPLSPEQIFDPLAMCTLLAEGCDLVVVDHYRLDSQYEARLRGWAEQILVIDDLGDRSHDCDWLLDPTLGVEPARYAAVTPPACKFLVGVDYALLRQGFARLRPQALARRVSALQGVRRVLVNLGATDPVNATLPVLQSLAALPDGPAVDVVMGAAAPYLAEVQAFIEGHGERMSLHVQTKHMADLMINADLAIGAGGGASWERCCLGLPTLSLVIADNQRFVAAALEAAGASRIVAPPAIGSEVARLAADPAALAEMGRRAALLCDGLGASRAVSRLFPIVSGTGRQVVLRRATRADGEIMLDWQSHPATRAYARNPAVPDRTEHFAWLDRKLASPQSLLCIVEANGVASGVVRLDPPDAMGWREVSIYLAPSAYGQGIAGAALRQLRRLETVSTFKAAVLPGNEVSLKLFNSAGYRRQADGWFILAAPGAVSGEA